jgi:hypothetical protein
MSFKDLSALDGPQITRFPPAPSGYMHMGHAKAAMINDSIAHDHGPGGKLIVRIDDTNPSKEKQVFQDAILDDLRTLKIFADKVSHSSDYFQVMYDYALDLIRSRKAFADDTVLGKGNDQRKSRKPSDRRDMSINETLRYFSAMHSGSPDRQNWCVRARIDYASPNGALCDLVIYRCNNVPHNRTGTTWHIYPTYDFCASVLDAVEGLTLDQITLMNWGNAYVRDIQRDVSLKVTFVSLDLNLTGDVRGTKKITWLATTPSNLVLVDLVSFDYLITKDKLDLKKDVLEEFLAKDTEKRVQAFADCNVKDPQRGTVIQFDRKGYYRLDDIDTTGIMVFFQIPTK